MNVELRCEGCGWRPPPLREAPLPFRCAHHGEGEVDHLLAPTLDARAAMWPSERSENPFIRYRTLLHAYSAARSVGLSDDAYVSIVEALDARVVAVDGRGFRITPFRAGPTLDDGSSPWVKDDSVNVSGSHKGRHLFGILVHLAVMRAAKLDDGDAPLAIASCGNAALAAAVLARAAERPLDVYVPPDAHPAVLRRLRDLRADVHVCEREPGETGDPCVAAFRHSVSRGWIPFACQGTDNGLTLDGGRTLGFELVDAPVTLDRVFVQVGGGALASSVARAFEEARALGVIPRVPRIMAVQGEAVAPLVVGYERAVQSVVQRVSEPMPHDPDARAGRIAATPALDDALDELTAHRAKYLFAWPMPGPSVAHGILDDETYDGVAVLRSVMRSGGRVLRVAEETLIEAERLGGGAVDATGTAGLAGLLSWTREHPRHAESRAVLFTGATR